VTSMRHDDEAEREIVTPRAVDQCGSDLNSLHCTPSHGTPSRATAEQASRAFGYDPDAIRERAAGSYAYDWARGRR
jgi:hypothetical protein